MEKNTVERVALCIFECDNSRVLERWTFDLHSFPSVGRRDRDVPFSSSDHPELTRKINLTDLEATFRATLSRISNSASKLRSLPEGDDAPECSFTITIEVKDGANRPVGRLEKQERQWIAAEPDQFDNREGRKQPQVADSTSGTTKTHSVRRLEAGEMRMEVWVEESAAKFSFPSSHTTASERSASLSYGAGTEKFDPVHGYDLEAPDINRKPGEGIGTDYRRG